MELPFKSFCSSVRTADLPLQSIEVETATGTLTFPPSHYEEVNTLYGVKFPPVFLWSTKDGVLGETAIFTLS